MPACYPSSTALYIASHDTITITVAPFEFRVYPFLLLEWILDHSHLFSEVSKLSLTQSFREDICHLLSCRNVLQLYNSSLDIVSDEVMSDVNVLRLIMKHKIFREQA